MHREHRDCVEPADRLLGAWVELADGFHLVTEQFQTDGALALGHEDIEDPAAHSELPDHLDRFPPAIAERAQAPRQFLEIDLVSSLDLPREIPIGAGRPHALQG